VEIEAGDGNDSKMYQVRISPVYNRNRQFSGHLLQLNDVTSLKQSENKLS
jgi:hypothetical protein